MKRILAIAALIVAAPLVPVQVAAEPQTLNVRASQGPVYVQVSKFDRRDVESIVTARITNGYSNAITLAGIDDTYLEVKSGERFLLSPPEDNRQLKIEGRSAIDASLVFVGPLPDGENVKLVFNAKSSPTSTVSPRITADLPLTATGQPATASAEKKTQ
jgi:hypothetical protein